MKPEFLFEIYKISVFQKDVSAFTSIFDEDIFVFDMWQRWTYDGLTSWREMAKNWFISLGADKDVVEFEDVHIQGNEEMVLMTAIAKFTAVSEKGEPLRYLQNRLTWVAMKKNDAWKIIHQHTSSPVDFETMKVILKR